ncbi:hypothetical protein [Paludibaculum fermentans]|uniref:hypothetical protein n=1 Tax=Paludibaculum fermentans TaxID=1473598 RepID=UPI003EB816B3
MFDVVPRNRSDLKAAKKRLKAEAWRVLAELGTQRGLISKYAGHPQEYLYDFVWLDGGGALALVVESETSMYGYDVLYDFGKLLHAKAPIKLILFLDSPLIARNGEIRRISVDMIENALNSYTGHVAGEEYIVVQFCNLRTRCLEAYRWLVSESQTLTLQSGESCKLVKFFSHSWTP